MIQVPSVVETPKNPEMVGIATFAIVVSRTTMKLASDRITAAMIRLPPLKGEWLEVLIVFIA